MVEVYPSYDNPRNKSFLENLHDEISAWLTGTQQFEVVISGNAPSPEAMAVMRADILERWKKYPGLQIEWKVDMAEDQVGLE